MPRETGLYYLKTRYYNPEIGRFISPDNYPTTGQGLSGNNMFVYCGNNPVNREDTSGCFWDTVFDVVSLVVSVVEVIQNPDDVGAWVGLVLDAADVVIPFVGGLGEVADVVNISRKAANAVDDMHDAKKAAEGLETAVKVHGNSLKTTKETVGYALRKNGTGEIMKFGETTRGLKRYTNKFYKENDVYMDVMATGSKYDMHLWQHEQILEHTKKYGVRPPWNKSDW